MKLFYISLLFCVMISGASADVQISNTYYTYGSTVHDDVNLKDNAEFASVVGIDLDSIEGKGGGMPVTSDEDSSFAASIIIDSKGSRFGGRTCVQAEDASWGKDWTAGKTNFFSLSYALGTGDAEAKGYRTGSAFEEDLVLEQTYYLGTITGSDEQVSLSGKGVRISTEDSDSDFEHTLKTSHGGEWGKIKGEANCVKDEDIDFTPTIYVWDVDAYGDNSVATSGMRIAAVGGDRPLDISLELDCSVPGLLPPEDKKRVKHLGPLDFGDRTIADMIALLDKDFTCEIWGGFVLSDGG